MFFFQGFQMKSLKILFLCLCRFFTITTSFAAEQKNPLQSDPRYVHAVYFLQSMSMDVDETSLQEKHTSSGTTLHVNIVDGSKNKQVLGSMFLYKETFYITVDNEKQPLAYGLSKNQDGNVSVNKVEFESEKDRSLSRQEKSMAIGSCSYIASYGFNFWACHSDDNPFGAISTRHTRLGSPITATQYTWRQDYLRRTYICPVNEFAGYNPYVTTNCGLINP